MEFFERYCSLCERSGIQPMAHETAKKFGVANATITYWGKRGNVPKGDTIVAMADFFGVSADYLLCRTDDETDYAKNSPKLTEKQKRLLRMFENADEALQEKVFTFLEIAALPDKETGKKSTTA